jgi:hypothetical protein
MTHNINRTGGLICHRILSTGFWFADTCKRLSKYCLRPLFIPFVSFIIVTRKNLPISVVHDETQQCAYSGRILISEISFVIEP